MSNQYEKLSLVSRPLERNSPVSLTTLCGSSSLLTHVTVVPTFTVSGAKLKSLMNVWVSAAAQAMVGGHTATNPTAAKASRAKGVVMFLAINVVSLLGECRIGEGQYPRMGLDADAGDAQHLGQQFGRNLERPRSRAFSGRRLRIRG